MPQRRKGPVPVQEPIPILLRDAQPTWREIEGEPDPIRREKAKQARDRATAELFRIYDAELSRNCDAVPRSDRALGLDAQIRSFCEDLMRHALERALIARKRQTGRPADVHERLLMAIDVLEIIDAAGNKHGSIQQAIREVAARRNKSEFTVRHNYYRGDGDPEWSRLVKISLALRRSGVSAQLNPVDEWGELTTPIEEPSER